MIYILAILKLSNDNIDILNRYWFEIKDCDEKYNDVFFVRVFFYTFL